MLENFGNQVLDVIPLIAAFVVLIFFWRVAHKHETATAYRIRDFIALALFTCAAYLGEQWFAHYGSMPFCFGFGNTLDARSDMRPIVLILLIGVVLTWIGKWLFSKLAKAYSNSSLPGKIEAVGISFAFVALWMVISFQVAAYNTKVSGRTPAREFVDSGTRTAGAIVDMIQDGLRAFNSQVNAAEKPTAPAPRKK